MQENANILQGIKLITLAYYVPGPVAVAKLGRMGAQVTRVEPEAGDPFIRLCPEWYHQLCAGHTVVRLDLKSEAGQEEMGELLGKADLFISSIRISALRHLGLDRMTLQQRYPRLCQLAIVGHPAPHQDRAGHDLTYLATCGLLAPPVMPRTLLADLVGAEQTVSSALALLLARERGQGAGYEEISLASGVEGFSVPHDCGLTQAGAILGGGSPRYYLYATRQGWIALSTLEEHFWQRLNRELGTDPALTGQKELREIFLGKTADEWEIWALERDLPLAAVRD